VVVDALEALARDPPVRRACEIHQRLGERGKHGVDRGHIDHGAKSPRTRAFRNTDFASGGNRWRSTAGYEHFGLSYRCVVFGRKRRGSSSFLSLPDACGCAKKGRRGMEVV